LNLIKDLLERGANVNAPAAAEWGRTALQAACNRAQPSLELIQFLLDNGAEVNADAGINGGLTALQGAAIQGHIKIVLLLINNGANVNAEPAIGEGRMALDGAAEHGRLDMVKLLLNAGAKSEEEGESGYDEAIELAEEHDYYFMRKVFEDHLKGNDGSLMDMCAIECVELTWTGVPKPSSNDVGFGVLTRLRDTMAN